MKTLHTLFLYVSYRLKFRKNGQRKSQGSPIEMKMKLFGFK